MYTRLLPVALGLLALTAQSSAQPATLPTPTVEYSADRIMETDKGTFTGKLYSTADKERSEMHMQGMQTVTILRRDRQVGWMLMPAQKMYREMDIAKAREQSASAPRDQVEITAEGTDSVEGHAATKYRMVMKDRSAGGFIWITAEGIPVKMDMLSKSGAEKSRVTVTLKNLQIGPQDSQLFDVPQGYTAVPAMKGFGFGKGLGGALKGVLPGRNP
jgi:hypothetical protein